MVSYKKTWQQKMQDKDGVPKTLELKNSFPCFNALAKMGAKENDTVVLVNPRDVEQIMKKIPYGKLITLKEICQALARKFNTGYCCTLTAGIFTMTAANAYEELKSQGEDNGNPYWRTLKIGGFLNPKYPDGQGNHKLLLEKEGFKVISKGNTYRVEDFENYLADIPG